MQLNNIATSREILRLILRLIKLERRRESNNLEMGVFSHQSELELVSFYSLFPQGAVWCY